MYAGLVPPDKPSARPPANPSVDAVRALARASRILERASAELSLPHYRVLAAIASGEERASRVAARLALGKPTISAAVDALTQRGLLAKSGRPDDQRVAVLRLTPAGEALLARVEAQMVERIDALCARTPDADRVREAFSWVGTAIDDAINEHRPVAP